MLNFSGTFLNKRNYLIKLVTFNSTACLYRVNRDETHKIITLKTKKYTPCFIGHMVYY